MFVSKHHIPRRTFLRGVGVTLALPLLDSMLPAQTPLRQTAANPKSRFVGIWHPHGAAPGYWSPATEGTNFEFNFTTSPLEPFRDQVVLITGLNATSSMATAQEPGGDHQRGGAFLSGARPRQNALVPYLGPTIDQIIAQKIGQDTVLPSIQLGVEDPGSNVGVCNFGYSCAYTNSISWPTPTKPLPMEINPQVVFERLFGDGSTSAERLARKERSGSILDAITRDVARLKNTIPAKDRNRLNDYLEDVREIERRIQIATKASADVPSIDVPFGVPESFDEHVKIWFDLQATAFQADITRVSTLMYGRDSSDRTYPESGFDGQWHSSSHHGDDPARVKNYAKMNQYHVKCLTYFLKKLKATPDGDGNILDHSLIYMGSNMGNSNRHSHINVPVILVGGASGQLNGGRHLVFPDDVQRTSNLLLTLLDKFGIHQDSIGDSTDRLEF